MKDEKYDDLTLLQKPSIVISFAQVIVFIVSYICVSYVAAYVLSLLAFLVQHIPIIGAFSISETILYTITPLCIGIGLFSIMALIFRKYMFGTIAMIVCFMFLSYGIISQIILTASNYGILSWDFFNELWLCVILSVVIIYLFYRRSEFYIVKLKDDISSS